MKCFSLTATISETLIERAALMCATVNTWAPLIMCSCCRMPNSWRTSYRFYLTLVCWSATERGKIFAEYKPFVTEMITKYKAPFHFVYSVSCWDGWVNSEKEEVSEQNLNCPFSESGVMISVWELIQFTTQTETPVLSMWACSLKSLSIVQQYLGTGVYQVYMLTQPCLFAEFSCMHQNNPEFIHHLITKTEP